jgi:hypothetical protein
MIDKEDQLWVRLCAVLPEQSEEWTITVLDITASKPPASWSDLLWSYPRALLRAEAFPGAMIAEWLRTQSVNLGDITAKLPELVLTDQCMIERRTSGYRGFHGRFEWPYDEWNIPFRHSISPTISDELIGDEESPSFLSVNVGIAALLGIELPPGGSFDARSMIFRQQFGSVRINAVHVYPATVVIDVSGEGLAGSTVELASNNPGPTVEIATSDDQSVELPTPNGLPDNAWVLLRRGRSWLDRRFLSYPYTREQAEDVDYWVEPESRLEALIASGESPTVEFKTEVPADRIRIMKTVAAFSNGEGGTILIGVAKDGTVIGAPVETASPDGQDTLTNLVRSWVSPLPSFEVQTIATGDGQRTVVAVVVNKGSQPPYGAGTTVDSLNYFIRRGATTFVASPDQVRYLARSTPPVEPPGLPGMLGYYQ